MVDTGKLGNQKTLSEAQAKGSAANVAASVAFGSRMMPTIKALVAEGKSLNAIAAQLKGMNRPIMRGGRWTAKAVSRAFGAIGPNEDRPLTVPDDGTW
jgi:hypothetical protein